MDSFSQNLLDALATCTSQIFAWCVLPNHYHTLVEARDVKKLLYQLVRLHGRSSFDWNDEDRERGRKVFFRAVERAMRSDRHFFATLNYVHHNPVRHGYVDRWSDWPWSSAAQYLAQTGAAEAKWVWKDYPIKDYGKGWDEPIA
jgi:putative transposase